MSIDTFGTKKCKGFLVLIIKYNVKLDIESVLVTKIENQDILKL